MTTWKSILKRMQDDSADIDWEILLDIESEKLKYVVENFFIRDMINPTIFWTNFFVFGNQDSTISLFDGENDLYKTLKPSPSLMKFVDVINRPIGWPKWFIISYPDVLCWFLILSEGHKSFVLSVFGTVDEVKLLDEKNKIKIEYLRILIDKYKKACRNTLECSVSGVFKTDLNWYLYGFLRYKHSDDDDDDMEGGVRKDLW